MNELTPAQLQAKIIYLEQKAARLESENLDLKVRSGLIKLKEAEPDGKCL